MRPNQTPQLLSEKEIELVERYRASCPVHKKAIDEFTEALGLRCAATHTVHVRPLILTRA